MFHCFRQIWHLVTGSLVPPINDPTFVGLGVCRVVLGQSSASRTIRFRNKYPVNVCLEPYIGILESFPACLTLRLLPPLFNPPNESAKVASPYGRSTLCPPVILVGCECTWLICNSLRSTAISIHVLDDDSLLNVFYLCRPFLLGEDQDNDAHLVGGEWQWVGENWWYKLAHVCRKWRNLILGSASYLGLSLVCTKGTPVADMLVHSPPFPLVIDYFDEDQDMPVEDVDAVILALKQRDRVRRVRLHMLVTNLQKLIMDIDDEYPILEYLIIMHRSEDINTILRFPETLQAPNLRHLAIIGFALPIRSRLLTTAVGLVTLCLFMDHPSTYFYPNTLLQWLSFLPQLETLVIRFLFPVSNHEVKRQLTHTPTMTPITLPNLYRFRFRGVSNYLEGFVHRIIAPRSEKLEIDFFNQLTFSVPCLLQFTNTIENLRFESAKFKFSMGQVAVEAYPHGETKVYGLSITVDCKQLDWQVSSAAQFSHSLGQTFSTVEHLTLEHEEHNWPSEAQNKVDHIEWCKLLSSFSNVKTFRIDNGLVEELSRCLQTDERKLPLVLLPELQELTYSESSNTSDAFNSFIEARQNAGRLITLVRCSPAQVQAHLSFEAPSTTPTSIEDRNDFYT